MAKSKNKITAIYVRVSTARQAEEGYSVPAQVERLTYYCKAQGWNNIKEYVDGGFSGSKLERPKIQELIEDANRGKISRVVVFKLDRLSRSQKDTLYLIEDVFLENDVEFISLNESIDTSTPYGKMMIGILSAFAQLERENIYLRTRVGMRERLRKGYWRGGGSTPFGYDYCKETGTLVPNEKADIVKSIYNLYLKGYSATRIAKMFNLSGDKLVTNILTHKVYIGIVKFKEEEFDGLHEALIPDELFELVQLKMKERGTKARASKTKYHLLSGLIYCGKCGTRMRYVSWSNNRYKLGCYARIDKTREYMHKDGVCDAPTVWADDIEKIVIDDLFRLSVTLKDSQRYKNNVIMDPLVELQSKITRKKNQMSRLLDIYTESASNIAVDVFNDKMAQYRSELDELEREYEIETKTQISQKNINLIIKQVTDIKDSWDFMSEQEKQSLIRSCVDSIHIYEDKIKINYTFIEEKAASKTKVA